MKSPEVKIGSEIKTIAQWCKEFGIFPQSVYRWIALGNSPEEAIKLALPKKVGRPKNDQTPLTKPPVCPKCDSFQTIWNGGYTHKGKRTLCIRCHSCRKASSLILEPHT